MEPQGKEEEFPSRSLVLAKHTKTAWNHKGKKKSSLRAALCWQNTRKQHGTTRERRRVPFAQPCAGKTHENSMEPQGKEEEFPSRSLVLAKHTKTAWNHKGKK